MKTLSIIILSYNVKKLLLDCLKSIPKNTDWEVIVVDNASSDDSVVAVKKHFPDITIVTNGENLGFAKANNITIKQSTGKFVLLLNPDTVIYPKSIETVLDYIKSHPKVGAATCRVELPDGTLDYSCHRGFPTPWNSLMHFLKLRSSYSTKDIPDTIHEIDALTGAFAMIRRTAGDQVGWLDEDYFWNGEDIDFCYKLKESGWKVVYIPDVKITHFKGASSKATPQTRRKWALNSTQVMELFYKKRLAQKYPFFVNWLVYLGIGILKFIRLIKN
ncbi:hypothetical protein A3D85_02440 [Candidatus Amesbacteria bacterium RIFCSPHIGHO2_02_FULL_47_9]|uniref:Uncharacterized protein n=1 Tax=Candidatus Amesbacteria bacterium RIFCSPHIGHO2_01_FULL_48_32b TaxID=1797253 RepID=A0A1F4YDM3_9BACT|nr:MAG: hypothetical protein A2876_03380 [Candidatus Amesbacteria bacterium RIFCSPHIGHO2_01_FULL_48_32b]OGD02326.1 MAG: hypothetical protein A3D85_02440 [Candidatus Amesbacteria bacterium RIFCSPHIGHO2_02_FULL_47_9]OGD08493.1 MAG: hypothetical protein A2899_01720 [Candidatus Amesbacteria bacterium RIFCSPLOWO2_01_FULL_49_25]